MDQLDELRLFLAIVDAGSFAAGGREVGRSPSSATRILGDMERRLGVRLLQRTTRRLALTDSGERLAEQARRLLPDFDEAFTYAIGEPEALRGRIRLSAPLFFGRRHFAPIVGAFLEAHPDITVQLSLEDRLVDLIEERIDVAVRIGHLESSSLVAKRVSEVSRVVVASPGYLKSHGTPRKPEDLNSHRVVLFQNHANGPAWTFRNGRARQTVKVKSRIEVDRAEVAISFAREGKGLTRVLSYQVVPELKDGSLVRVLRAYQLPPLPVQLIYPNARLMAPKVRVFLDFAASGISRLELDDE
jgi:DNA-binding transcriptional LysR family regulator